MRNKGWLAIALLMIFPVMAFTASCSKKNVVQSEPASMAGPQVQKAPDKPAEVAQPAVEAQPNRRLEEDRLRAEADAREAALKAFVGENIPFAFDSYLLSDQARQILIGKAEYLRTNPDIKVTVEGHCDDRGTGEYNIALGERRAESVKRYLLDLGVGTDRLNTVSFGEEKPIAMEHDEASWARNRRAQFVISGSPDDRTSSKAGESE